MLAAGSILPGKLRGSSRGQMVLAAGMILLRIAIMGTTMVLSVDYMADSVLTYVLVASVLLDVVNLLFMYTLMYGMSTQTEQFAEQKDKHECADSHHEGPKHSRTNGPVSIAHALDWAGIDVTVRVMTVDPPPVWREATVGSKAATLMSLVPNSLLVRSLAGRKANWERIHHIADNIRKPEYDLATFYSDCLDSFPELSLFVSRVQQNPSTRGVHANFHASKMRALQQATTSGVAGEVEYQRTMGAMFAVYWMLRLDIDGRVGLCYGVDEAWRSIDGSKEGLTYDMDRRSAFLKLMDWQQLSGLVARAGCATSYSGYRERVVALICLTCYHDIMKVPALQPIVQPDHAPYHGYEAGVRIIDHDIALSYVLEHYPELLPSNKGLSSEQRRQVLFTQGKMRFNHGWFVQGEAPPGEMLAYFKNVLKSGASQMDIDFYFLHWITDLAGAEATPLGGAEKLVLKMPRSVLSAFLWSMPYLSKLVSVTETELVETYLCARWRDLAGTHTVPSDWDAIAIMRLTIMAQGDPPLSVVEAFRQLPPTDQACIVAEMSRTGCEGQNFLRNSVSGGPAFLVYYAPALLQRNNASTEGLQKALHVLAVVLRAARAIWPMTMKKQGKTVIIMIAELKSDVIEKIVHSTENSVWVLLHQNDREAIVTLKGAGELNTLYSEGARFRVLDFSKADAIALDKPPMHTPANPEEKSMMMHPTGSWRVTKDLHRWNNSPRLLVFTAMSTDCTKECAVLWLMACLNCRTTLTVVELVMTDSQARFQWMEHVFADKFVRGGEWVLTEDKKAFVAGNVLVRMYLAHSPSREPSCIEEFMQRAPDTRIFDIELGKAGRQTCRAAPNGLSGLDYDKVPAGALASIIVSAPIPDVNPKFFERFTSCRRTFVVGTPGGINCPMPSWVELLAAMHSVSTVIYLTPELTRSVRFPRNYVVSNPAWPEILRRAVWDATLTCMARRPEISAEFGSWGLILRLNAANASFCRGWYRDVAGDTVDKLETSEELVEAVKAYVDRYSGDDREVGNILDELRMTGVSLQNSDLQGQVDKRGRPMTPRAKEILRASYRAELYKAVSACINVTEMLLFRNPKNQRVRSDDLGMERLMPCCGYTEPHKDLSKLFGVDDAISLLMELPIRWLTPAYDVVGMVCGERALDEGGDVDGGLGLVLHEAGDTLGLGMLSAEQRNRSDNPVLMTPVQAAGGIYAAGPFN